jgi:hypothetical protein
MDKSSTEADSHIVESARVARELQALWVKMTPRQQKRSELILERLLQNCHTHPKMNNL